MTLPRGPEPHEWDRHMSAEDAMSRMVQRTGIAVWESRAAHVEAIGTAVINTARELYGLSLAGADHDSDIWIETQGRMFDLVQQLPIDLVPAALMENRVAEVAYRSSSQAGLASVADGAPTALPHEAGTLSDFWANVERLVEQFNQLPDPLKVRVLTAAIPGEGPYPHDSGCEGRS